jgi:hypothetical protein
VHSTQPVLGPGDENLRIPSGAIEPPVCAEPGAPARSPASLAKRSLDDRPERPSEADPKLLFCTSRGIVLLRQFEGALDRGNEWGGGRAAAETARRWAKVRIGTKPAVLPFPRDDAPANRPARQRHLFGGTAVMRASSPWSAAPQCSGRGHAPAERQKE